ncbi:MAG: diaminopimelate decarboxylase [Nitrospirota bacterium]
MHDFKFKNNLLYCEEVPIDKIARKVGTPFYLYSNSTLQRHFEVFDSSFSGVPHIISYAVKANSNLAILKILAQKGCGADIVSGGELYRALQAGISPDKIVFAGVGKRADEIRYALESDILMFNVESSQELEMIDKIAKAMGRRARIALRVNPDISASTHPYISTGLKNNKFGISINIAIDEYIRANDLKNIEIAGIHKHIGSQITEVRPIEDAVRKIVDLIYQLQDKGIEIRYIDIGGGFGIAYDTEEPPYPSDFADAVIPLISGLNCRLILEPGRIIVGNAGILITSVLYTKRGEGKNFIITDAGMNDLMRPTLYDAYHYIQPVFKKDNEEIIADVVGPICESGDFIAKDRKIERIEQGDMLAVMSAGAYGFSMSSNYNSRPRVPEVLVAGDRYSIIRERETYQDLIKGEKIPSSDLFQ